MKTIDEEFKTLHKTSIDNLLTASSETLAAEVVNLREEIKAFRDSVIATFKRQRIIYY